MAIIKSGASSDTLTVDATSKASRVTPYDTLGTNRGIKRTYRASTTTAFAAAAGTAPFFLLYGSATQTLRIQRIRVSGLTITAVAYNSVNVTKYSTAASGGTPVALTLVPLDSASAASTASLCSVYTAAPTAGTLVGTLASRRTLLQATTAVAGGPYENSVLEWDFRDGGEAESVVLRGVAQGLGLLFPAAPATAVTMSLEVEWTEE